MFKTALAGLFTLLMLIGSTAFADDHDKDKDKCNPKKVTGSYVALRPNTFSGSGLGILDQLKLNSDGTAYWYQSTSFDLFISAGTVIPEIGSWECREDGTLVVTTVGVTYQPTGAGDTRKDTNTRFTQKLAVIDGDTLQTIRRVFRSFPLTSDPLDPQGGTITGDSQVAFQYKRVKPIPSDAP
jgi:hypothetical protein